MQKSFDRFIIDKNDEIDNAAFNLLSILSDGQEVWDMEKIGRLTEYAKSLIKRDLQCHPYFEGDEEVPCYLGEDCKRTECCYRAYLKN